MTLLAALWLALAFAVFAVLLWSVYAVNGLAARRFGYEPFALPNAALMLVANLLLLSALAPMGEGGSGAATTGGQGSSVMLIAAAALSAGMLGLLLRRVGFWLALYATLLMALGAIAILPSLVFMRLTAQSREAP